MYKSTDVSGSIAGYYFQILLACKELTSNIDKVAAVGVETGADVRIINYSGQKNSIEAKFHKKNMSLYDKDIIKTIYNFYRYSSTDKKLTLSTNVSISNKNKEFFKKWESGDLDINEKKIYIRKCILRHCKNYVKPFNNKYNQYKHTIDVNENLKCNKKEPYYIDKLEKSIFDKGEFNINEYKEYAYLDEKININNFIEKINFNFRDDNSKLDSVSKLKKEIKENLKDICDRKGKDIEENDYEVIQNLMLDKFFGIIVKNSSLGTNPKFQDMKKFSVKDLINCITNYKEEKLEWLCKEQIKHIIEQINNDEEIFDELIRDNNHLIKKDELIKNHNLIKLELLKKITDEDFYNSFIKTYALDSKDVKEGIIPKLINHLTIISVYENKKVDDINFLEVDDSIENIFIKDLIKYTFKVCPDCYKNISIDVKKFLQDLKENYGETYISRIDKNLIVVFDGQFNRKSRPCEKNIKEVLKFLDDISIADEDIMYKKYNTFKNIDYRCSNCLSIDGSDKDIEENVNAFLNCRKEKEENGVYN